MHTIRYHNFYLYTISFKAIAYGVMLEIKKYDCNTEVNYYRRRQWLAKLLGSSPALAASYSCFLSSPKFNSLTMLVKANWSATCQLGFFTLLCLNLMLGRTSTCAINTSKDKWTLYTCLITIWQAKQFPSKLLIPLNQVHGFHFSQWCSLTHKGLYVYVNCLPACLHDCVACFTAQVRDCWKCLVLWCHMLMMCW